MKPTPCRCAAGLHLRTLRAAQVRLNSTFDVFHKAIRPRLMLADEPTSKLDSTTGRQILSLLRALADHEGMTMVLVTHDPAAADFATELYQLRDGRIVAREW